MASPKIDKIYYNLVIGYSERDTSANCKAELNFSEDSVILEKASDYYLSVIRFDIPTSSIPLLFCDIERDQANPNLSQYSVTLSYNGSESKVNLLYNTSRPNEIVPTVNVDGTYPRTLYYAMYTYRTFLKMLNEALETSFSNLIGTPLGSKAPLMLFDEGKNLFYWEIDERFYESDLVTPIEIFFDNKLFTFFEGFEVEYYSRTDPNGKDVKFVIERQGSERVLILDPNTLILYQDYSTISSWNCFRSLQIRSPGLGTSNEYIPTGFESNSTSSTAPIIADFIPLFGESPGSSVTRSNLHYTLDSSYKLINMVADSPLTKMSLQVCRKTVRFEL
jgi:hypothetical protein